MKILVTGANGMVGSDLCPVLLKEGHEIFKTDIITSEKVPYLDICELKQVKSCIEKNRIEMIMHLAAKTDVDKCETEIEDAYLTNTIGTENVALACKEYNLPLVYISTAAVFHGKKGGPYIEFDSPNPVNVYGKTKWEGEKIVQNLLSQYFIFRASWMIGGGKKDKKFVAKIYKLIKEKREISVVTDKRGSPTFTEDFARGIIAITKTGRYGIYHMANQGSCSRFEIAQKIVENLGEKIKLKPITSDAFPLPAPRPDSEVLYNFKLHLLRMKDLMPSWEEALKKYLNTLSKEQ